MKYSKFNCCSLKTLLLLHSILFTQSALAVSCSVNILTSMTFGAYDPFLTNKDVDSTGTIKIACNDNTRISYTISFSTGFSGNYATRKMNLNGGSGELNYNLYTTSSRATNRIWGDGTSGTQTISANARCLTASSCKRTVYGRVTRNQNYAKYGNYNDNIVISVQY